MLIILFTNLFTTNYKSKLTSKNGNGNQNQIKKRSLLASIAREEGVDNYAKVIRKRDIIGVKEDPEELEDYEFEGSFNFDDIQEDAIEELRYKQLQKRVRKEMKILTNFNGTNHFLLVNNGNERIKACKNYFKDFRTDYIRCDDSVISSIVGDKFLKEGRALLKNKVSKANVKTALASRTKFEMVVDTDLKELEEARHKYFLKLKMMKVVNKKLSSDNNITIYKLKDVFYFKNELIEFNYHLNPPCCYLERNWSIEEEYGISAYCCVFDIFNNYVLSSMHWSQKERLIKKESTSPYLWEAESDENFCLGISTRVVSCKSLAKAGCFHYNPKCLLPEEESASQRTSR